jgi:hypothetical protein
LVAGIVVAITGSLFVHFGFLGDFVAGWGMIFVVIGIVLIVYGSLTEETKHVKTYSQRFCPYCGRHVELGAMFCSRCGKA